jgi:taurine dioxygenase
MNTVTRIGGNLGARIEGIDFSSELTQETLDFITQALYEHQVVSLPATDMSSEQHRQIASCFGELEHQATDQFSVDPEHPFITVIDSDNGDRADSWHADETFLEHPPLVNLLHAKVLPDHGGDTAFRSTAAAYSDLSDKMKELLGDLTAMHDYGHLYELGWRSGIPLAELVADALAKGLLHSHPIVRNHRVTGRKWLTVNPTYTRFVEGLPPLEARYIQELLFAHMQKPEFAFRHHWQVGDLLIWDQEAVQHYAVGDYQGRRLMHRISALASTATYTGVKTA